MQVGFIGALLDKYIFKELIYPSGKLAETGMILIFLNR